MRENAVRPCAFLSLPTDEKKDGRKSVQGEKWKTRENCDKGKAPASIESLTSTSQQ